MLGSLRFAAEFKACALGVKGFQAHVAQAVEHFLGKEEVTGSSPVVGSSTIHVLHTVEPVFVK